MDKVLEAIVERIPHPNVNREGVCRALIFDGWYDRYRGFLSMIYVADGFLKVNDEISIIPANVSTDLPKPKKYIVKGLGLLRPNEEKTERL